MNSRFGVLRMAWLLLATGIVVGLFLFTRSVDLELHNQRMTQLLQLKELDASLDRDVFRVNAFMLLQYDPLVETTRKINALTALLKEEENKFYGHTGGLVDKGIDAYLSAMSNKLEVMERIKFEAALVRNTLNYLPTLAREIHALDTETQHSELNRIANMVIELSNDLLIYSTFTTESQNNKIRAGLTRLEKQKLPGKQRKLLSNFQFHTLSGLNGMQKLAELQDEYLRIPSQSIFDELHAAYSRYYDVASKRSEMFSLVLLGLTILLFGAFYWMMNKLDVLRERAEAAWDRLHDAVESLSEAFALFDRDGRLVLNNRKWLEFYPWQVAILNTGVRHNDLQVTNTTKLVKRTRLSDSDSDDVAQNYYEQLSNGRWYLASDSQTGDGGTACVRVNITQVKHAEAELRKLSLALEQSPAAIMITDLNGDIEYVNPKFEENSGYSAAEVLGKNPRFLKSGDKSREEYSDLWQTILAGKEWRGQFQNKRKDGSLYWESATISPLRGEDGSVSHFIAVKEDVTARKRAEDQLRLNATVFDTTTEGIIVTDENNRIVTVNPAFCRITGYEPQEVIGQEPSMLASGKHDAMFYEELWEQLKKRGFWSGEIWNRRKDGSVFPEWLSITVIRDEQGNIKEHVAVFSDITQRKEDEEQIRYQAEYDALTHLPNRTLLFDRLKQAIAFAKRESSKLALLFLDLDLFKTVNDSLGHVVGDELLQEVAVRLEAAVRESDTVARFGGDEFVILLQDVTDVEVVANVAGKIISDICRPFHIGNRDVYIGASVGITLYPDDSVDANTMLQHADLAMYRAKDAGRNNYQFFDVSMQEQVRNNMELEQDLRQALEQESLELYYQPVISVETGEVTSAEALLRWNHPVHGYVPPATFISLAEESGLIGSLGLWVLRNACAQFALWQQEGLLDNISVNVSSRQRGLGLTAEVLKAILDENGLTGPCLTLELTESLFLDQNDEVNSWLASMKTLGLRLSIDDFGTGYSSLSYLRRFPIDIIKIDRTFIDDIPGGPGGDSLVDAILAMATSLGLVTVAEGVTSKAQIRFLEQRGCDYFQGYYFSQPIPGEQFTEWLRDFRFEPDIPEVQTLPHA